MNKVLFLNHRYINTIHNLELKFHTPNLISKHPYIDPAIDIVNLQWAYPTVFYIDQLEGYVMYYQGWSVDHTKMRHNLPLMAFSENGIDFTPLNADQYFPYPDKIMPNQTLPQTLKGGIYSESQFFYLEHLKEKYMILSLYRKPDNTFAAVTFMSADGLHYREIDEPWYPGSDAPDLALSIAYNKDTSSYHLYHRPRHTDRRISVSITKDFRTYRDPQLILQPDTMDHPLADFYGSHIFLEENYGFVGFLMIYVTPNSLNTSSVPGHKFVGGPVINQLIYSEDGIVFNRGYRENFFKEFEDKYHCIYPSCIIKEAERYIIYASATEEWHGMTTPGKGKILVFELRKDGFASIEAKEDEGEMVTRPLWYQGGQITFNLTSLGETRIKIGDAFGRAYDGFDYDDCIPYQGNNQNHVFEFKNKKMEALSNQVITISYKSSQSNLFSISGNFDIVTPHQVIGLIGNKK